MNGMGSFNPAQYIAPASEFSQDVGLGWEYIRIINNSPYLLNVGFGGQGTFTFPEQFLEDVPVTRQFNGKVTVSATANFPVIAINQALSTLVSLNVYLPGEISQPQAHALPTVTGIGGGILSQNQAIVNIGQPDPTPIITATPNSSFAAATHLQESTMQNDGKFFMGDAGTQSFGSSVSSDGHGTLNAQTFVANTGIGFPANLSTFQGQAPVKILTGNQISTGVGATYSNAVAGNNPAAVGSWPAVLTNVPSSITLASFATSNESGPVAQNATVARFSVVWTVGVNGATQYMADVTSVGN